MFVITLPSRHNVPGVFCLDRKGFTVTPGGFTERPGCGIMEGRPGPPQMGMGVLVAKPRKVGHNG